MTFPCDARNLAVTSLKARAMSSISSFPLEPMSVSICPSPMARTVSDSAWIGFTKMPMRSAVTTHPTTSVKSAMVASSTRARCTRSVIADSLSATSTHPTGVMSPG